MSNIETPASSTPWWFVLIDKYGISTVLLIAFLAMYSGYIPTPLATAKQIDAVSELHNLKISNLSVGVESMTDQHKDIAKILMQICINTSKSEAQQAACLR